MTRARPARPSLGAAPIRWATLPALLLACTPAPPGGEEGRTAGAAEDAAAMENMEHRRPSARPGEDDELVTWAEEIEVASGEAYQGPWRMNESDFRYVDAPTPAITPEGEVGVAWVDQARKDVFFQRYGPDGGERLDAPVNVSRSPDVFSWLPRLAISPNEPDRIFILWQEIVFSGGSHGGEIFFARSNDGGRAFGDPVNLSNSPAGAGKGRLTAQRWDNGSLDLAIGPEGELYVAWTEYEGALWFRRSTDGGASFSDPVRVGGAGSHEPARGPALAVGAGGHIFLAWTVGEDPAADIRLARSDDGGLEFDEPRIPFRSEGHADGPKVAVDGRGAVHLVYAESADGPFGHYRIRHARSADGGTTFEDPREISGAHGEAFESLNFPDLAVDGADRLYVLWELFRDRREYSRGLGFTASWDGGRSFAPPATVPGTADPELGFSGSLQGLLMRKLAVNDVGAIAVVNSRFRPGEGSRVRLIRGQAATR